MKKGTMGIFLRDFKLKETWHWFGPLDKINLSEIAQTGAKGIVTSL